MKGETSHLSLSALFVFAACFGVLTGLGEVSLLAAKKIFLQQFIRTGANSIWMTPLADLVLFSIVALLMILVSWPRPKLITVRRVSFVFAFLSFLSLLFMYSALHTYTSVLLAAGLAMQTSRVIAAYPRGSYRLARRGLVWSIVLVTTISVGAVVWRAYTERRALAQAPQPRPGAPNVLLIVLDTVRAQNLSLYGYSRPTSPQLESIAKTGVRFDQAMSTAPWTLPSHASILTGRWPHELSADWFKSLNDSYPTIAETLSANGYDTAGFVANRFYCASETGLARGFIRYEDYSVSPGEVLLSSSLGQTISNNNVVRRLVGYNEVLANKSAGSLNADFLRWLSRDRQRPFFAFLNYYDAHEVYLPPKPFNGMFGNSNARNYKPIKHEARRNLRQDWHEMSPVEIQLELNAYDEAIAYLDNQIGALFEELRKRGVLDNTLVIVTSDHGEQFGEHRLFMHGNSLYSQLLHVPLLILLPKHAPEALTVSEPVSLRDIPATIVDLAGAESGAPFPGESLARFWREPSPLNRTRSDILLAELTGGLFGREWYPALKGDMKSLRMGQYHYIKNGDGGDELYDLKIDPHEQNNLAPSSKGRELLNEFRASLEQIVQPNKAEKLSLQRGYSSKP